MADKQSLVDKIVSFLPKPEVEAATVVGSSPLDTLESNKSAAQQIARNIVGSQLGADPGSDVSGFDIGALAAKKAGGGKTAQKIAGNIAQYAPLAASMITPGPKSEATSKVGKGILELPSKTEEAAKKFGKTKVLDTRPLEEIHKESNILYDTLIGEVKNKEVLADALAGMPNAMKQIKSKRLLQKLRENTGTIKNALNQAGLLK